MCPLKCYYTFIGGQRLKLISEINLIILFSSKKVIFSACTYKLAIMNGQFTSTGKLFSYSQLSVKKIWYPLSAVQWFFISLLLNKYEIKVTNTSAYFQSAINITFSPNDHRKETNREVPIDELINVCLVKETGVAGPVSCFPANTLHSISTEKEIIFLYAVNSCWKNCAHSPKHWSSARDLGSTCLDGRFYRGLNWKEKFELWVWGHANIIIHIQTLLKVT